MNTIINEMFSGALLSRDTRDLSNNARILGPTAYNNNNNNNNGNGNGSGGTSPSRNNSNNNILNSSYTKTNAKAERIATLSSLKNQAGDALADSRYATAEFMHRERIAMVEDTSNGHVSNDSLHEVIKLTQCDYI
jgi:hypothetical protein